MLVFNCTKAAVEFLTVTRKGEKHSCIEPAPHKTIAESVGTSVFKRNVDNSYDNGFQWQWVVHCVSIKRKKYLLVMDYHSRFCLTFLAGKKGDQYEFLNTFEPFLKASFHSLAREKGIDETDIENSLADYDRNVTKCAFHARSDRSVQAHLNDVFWHLDRHCYQNGMLLEEVELIGFNLFMAQLPRNRKDKKAYFFPGKEFLRFWQEQYLEHSQSNSDNIIVLDNYRQ